MYFQPQILKMIKSNLDQDSFEMVCELFDDTDVRMVTDCPVKCEIKEILPTIRVQAQIAANNNYPMLGVKQLIENMSELNGNDFVLKYGFISQRFAGDFFFGTSDEKFVGARLVKRRIEIRQ